MKRCEGCGRMFDELIQSKGHWICDDCGDWDDVRPK